MFSDRFNILRKYIHLLALSVRYKDWSSHFAAENREKRPARIYAQFESNTQHQHVQSLQIIIFCLFDFFKKQWRFVVLVRSVLELSLDKWTLAKNFSAGCPSAVWVARQARRRIGLIVWKSLNSHDTLTLQILVHKKCCQTDDPFSVGCTLYADVGVCRYNGRAASVAEDSSSHHNSFYLHTRAGR